MSALAGCGSSNAQQRIGRRAGEAFVCEVSQIPYGDAWSFALAFRVWIAGQATGQHAPLSTAESCPPAPTRPLSSQARAAAAQVALSYAASNRDRIAGQSAPAAGGRDLIDYLRAHGVS